MPKSDFRPLKKENQNISKKEFAMQAIVVWLLAIIIFQVVIPGIGFDLSGWFHQNWWSFTAQFLTFLISWGFLGPIGIPIVASAAFGRSRPKKGFFQQRPLVVFIAYAVAVLIWLIVLLGWKTQLPNVSDVSVSMPEVDWSKWAWRFFWLIVISGVVALLIKRPLKSSFYLDERNVIQGRPPLPPPPSPHWWSIVSLIGFFGVIVIMTFSFHWWLLLFLPIFWILGGVIEVRIREIAVVTFFQEPVLNPWTLWLSEPHRSNDAPAPTSVSGTFLSNGLNILPLPVWLPFVGLTLLRYSNIERDGQTEFVPTKSLGKQSTDPNKPVADNGQRALTGPTVQAKFRINISENIDPFVYLRLGDEDRANVINIILRACADKMARFFLGKTIEEIQKWPGKPRVTDQSRREDGSINEEWDNFEEELNQYIHDQTGVNLVSLQIADIQLDPSLQQAIEDLAAANTQVERARLLGQAAGTEKVAEIREVALSMGLNPDAVGDPRQLDEVLQYILNRVGVGRSQHLIPPNSTERVPLVIPATDYTRPR